MLINQSVEVHWRLPTAHPPDRMLVDDKVVRQFDNLIPACEFAVAMAKDGNLSVTVFPDSGKHLNLSQAQEIVTAWETGKIAFDATEVEI